MIAAGTQVSYQYRKHHLLGGEMVHGTGKVLDWTMVGTDRAYVIEPTDCGPVVHVKCPGVRALAA